MATSRFLNVAAVVLLTIVAALPATAGKPKQPATPPAPPDTRKVVQSINAAASSVVIENMRDKSVHTYKIDDITAVKIANETGKFSDIKAGMLVTDSVERDNDTLDSITVEEDHTPKPAKKPAAAPKKNPPAKPPTT